MNQQIPAIASGVLQSRLAALREEYVGGQRLLADLEARATTLREQLLRIDGAVQVLNEVLGDPGAVPITTPGAPD